MLIDAIVRAPQSCTGPAVETADGPAGDCRLVNRLTTAGAASAAGVHGDSGQDAT